MTQFSPEARISAADVEARLDELLTKVIFFHSKKTTCR